jgi:lyso-ornithine lipid O-acyltransferase
MLPPFLVRSSLAAPAERERVRRRWVGSWCARLLRVFGVRVLVEGTIPSNDRGHLVVSNHRSTADILVLLRAFGGTIVSRKDLSRWPLVGPAARAAGTVFVDRDDAVSGAMAMRTIRRRLAGHSTVIVFPEGTTFPGDEVRPFRLGAFAAALRSGADVVPVGLAYARDSQAAFVGEPFLAHLSRMAAAEPSTVAMRIGEPIRVEPGARSASLRDRAMADVQRLVHEARQLVDRA